MLGDVTLWEGLKGLKPCWMCKNWESFSRSDETSRCKYDNDMSSELGTCRWMKIRRDLSPNRCARLGSLVQKVGKGVGAERMVRCQVKMAYFGR